MGQFLSTTKETEKEPEFRRDDLGGKGTIAWHVHPLTPLGWRFHPYDEKFWTHLKVNEQKLVLFKLVHEIKTKADTTNDHESAARLSLIYAAGVSSGILHVVRIINVLFLCFSLFL
jgi:hypothetical protein